MAWPGGGRVRGHTHSQLVHALIPLLSPSSPPLALLSCPPQEFLMVNVERTKNECENRLRDAFAHFDKEKGSGRINQETLWQVRRRRKRTWQSVI